MHDSMVGIVLLRWWGAVRFRVRRLTGRYPADDDITLAAAVNRLRAEMGRDLLPVPGEDGDDH